MKAIKVTECTKLFYWLINSNDENDYNLSSNNIIKRLEKLQISYMQLEGFRNKQKLLLHNIPYNSLHAHI